MVKIVEGDLLEAKEDIIAHQVNCMGVMDAGVAARIRLNFGRAFNSYKELCNEYLFMEKELLGRANFVNCNGKIIANLFGQFHYGKGSLQVYTDYDAIKSALTKLKLYAMDKNLSIAIPYKIGCVNAGGDWNFVLNNIIEPIFNDYDVTVYSTTVVYGEEC